MAPIKALCTESFEDWTKKLGPLGLKCMELTADSEVEEYFELQDVHIILTTPVGVRAYVFYYLYRHSSGISLSRQNM